MHKTSLIAGPLLLKLPAAIARLCAELTILPKRCVLSASASHLSTATTRPAGWFGFDRLSLFQLLHYLNSLTRTGVVFYIILLDPLRAARPNRTFLLCLFAHLVFILLSIPIC